MEKSIYDKDLAAKRKKVNKQNSTVPKKLTASQQLKEQLQKNLKDFVDYL